MQLEIGDVVLSKRLTGFQWIGSTVIAWWLHSNWSHVQPVLDNEMVLDITIPKPIITSASVFLSPNYNVKVLRPVVPLTDAEKEIWVKTAIGLSHLKYDLESFEGFILDDGSLHNKNRVNCAEGTLICHKAINRLSNYDGRLVSPQTFENFASAGMYDVVYEQHK